MRIDDSGPSPHIEPPPPPPPPPPDPPAPAAHPSGAHARIDDGVDPPPARSIVFEAPPLQQREATTLYTEDANDDQVNCLDRAVDAARALPPGDRSRAAVVLLADTRPGPEGQSGHAVVRVGDDVIDPSSHQRYASTDDYLAANPQYREAGSIPADKAIGIFDASAGSPARAQALAAAGVPDTLRNMLVADPGGDGDRSLAARVKVQGPDIIPNRADSEAAGRQDGASLNQAIDKYLNTPQSDGHVRDALMAEMSKLRAHRDDPAYATSLLQTVGSKRLTTLFSRDPKEVVRPPQDELDASSDAMVDVARENFGDLVNAFHVSDKSGMLPAQMRQDVLDMGPRELGRFLRLGPEDGSFARDAAHKILDFPGQVRDGAMHDMLLSYQDPHLLLELMGNDKYAKEIFDSTALHLSRHGSDDLEKTLIPSLGAAFYSDVPGSPAHQAAMANVIKLAKDGDFKRELAGSPELAKTLATHFEPYMEGAGYAQALENARGFEGLDIPPPKGPLLPAGVGPNDVAAFFGGLVQHKDVYTELLGKASDLLKNGHLAQLLNDPANLEKGLTETSAFQSATMADLGEVSLVLQGIKSAGLDHDRAVNAVADVLGNYGVGILTDKAGPVASALLQDKLKPALEQLAEHIVDRGGQHDQDFQKYNDEVRKLFTDTFHDSLAAANDKLPPGKRLDHDRIQGMVNNFDAYFDSAVLGQMEQVFQAHRN